MRVLAKPYPAKTLWEFCQHWVLSHHRKQQAQLWIINRLFDGTFDNEEEEWKEKWQIGLENDGPEPEAAEDTVFSWAKACSGAIPGLLGLTWHCIWGAFSPSSCTGEHLCKHLLPWLLGLQCIRSHLETMSDSPSPRAKCFTLHVVLLPPWLCLYHVTIQGPPLPTSLLSWRSHRFLVL